MTRQLKVPYHYPVNVRLLDEQLGASFGVRYEGLTTRPGMVVVLLTTEPTPTDETTARAVLGAHDARELSAAERRVADRQTTLAALEAADEPVSLADFAGATPALRKLARKVLLLEAQLRAGQQRLDKTDETGGAA